MERRCAWSFLHRHSDWAHSILRRWLQGMSGIQVVTSDGAQHPEGESMAVQMPADVVNLINSALVSELTVIDRNGGLHTDPLIPMWDGRHILMTSSILFSAKLQ